jgi:hypothetical protein
MLLIDEGLTTQSSFSFEPRPQGHAHTVACGSVLKFAMSMHTVRRQELLVGGEKRMLPPPRRTNTDSTRSNASCIAPTRLRSVVLVQLRLVWGGKPHLRARAVALVKKYGKTGSLLSDCRRRQNGGGK